MLKIKNLVKCLSLAGMALSSLTFGQESYRALAPVFGADVEFSSGVENLDGNRELEVIPGVSSDYNADLDLRLKGSFNKYSEYGVEKEDGIEYYSGIGYEAGMSLDMTKLYEAAGTSSTASSASDSNHYSLIQPMIDWYEKNMARYGLPSDPCNAGSMWPTTSYGASAKRYQFIVGSTVEKASDVNWTSQKWADAEALYQEIKYDISNTIDNLYLDQGLTTGDVSELKYQDMSDETQKFAELKMKAKREFRNVYSGTSASDGNTLADSVQSAYINITNILGLLDADIDFKGKRLSAGNKIYSSISGQTESGSALTLALKKGLVQGLEAKVSTGIAGGEEQEAEDYDTESLDYYRGMSGELAVKALVKYSTFIEKTGGTFTAYADGVMSDLLVRSENFASSAGVSYDSATFVSWHAGAEGMILNFADRRVDPDVNEEGSKARLSWAAAADLGIGAFGAQFNAKAQYKSSYFSHKTYSSIEDRLLGYSYSSDYYIANLKNALMYDGYFSFNPEYFTGYDFISLKAGTDGFMYGTTLAGMGFYGEMSLGLKDLVNLPLTLYGSMDYYRNSILAQFSDYSSLPEQGFMEFTSVKGGLCFEPVKHMRISVEYASRPSYSRRATERVSSVTCCGQINFD